MIGIIDYRMGNLRSVQKAFEKLGHDASILRSPDDAHGIDKLVLPGVGAFADGIVQLRELGWDAAIRTHINADRPLLGICLGMQLLFESSEEDAASPEDPVEGMAILPGRVRRFPSGMVDTRNARLKVPHMGWNALQWTRADPLLAGLTPGDAVYFVHSYYVEPAESADNPLTTATCDYGITFTATVWRDVLWAAQFHPEKSQRVGLQLLDNFACL